MNTLNSIINKLSQSFLEYDWSIIKNSIKIFPSPNYECVFNDNQWRYSIKFYMENNRIKGSLFMELKFRNVNINIDFYEFNVVKMNINVDNHYEKYIDVLCSNKGGEYE